MGGLDSIWTTVQNLVQAVNAIGKTLSAGIAITSAPPVYAVAALPSTAATGALAWASNGRKPGEGAGAGTGVPIFFNPATGMWYSSLSGTQVLA